MMSGFITIIYCIRPFQRKYILRAALTFKESTSTFRDKKKIPNRALQHFLPVVLGAPQFATAEEKKNDGAGAKRGCRENCVPAVDWPSAG